MLTTLAISNYRSLRQVVLPLERLNVITGANGTGKSNLYRALRLLADVAQGRVVTQNLSAFDSMMAYLSDPRSAPEMLALRESIRAWRFYDHFRTDAQSPVRSPQIGTWTPILGDDGFDLASAIQTIVELGDGELLDAAITDAFPGSKLSVMTSEPAAAAAEAFGGGRFALQMSQHGLLRPLSAAELSDGTLRYLLWIAALLTPRPPTLMVLNEPETSLHPDLLGPLARLIAKAAARTQVVVVTHSPRLISSLEEQPGCHSICLEKKFGETVIASNRQRTAPAWKWPAR